jgi:hypothetical protein
MIYFQPPKGGFPKWQEVEIEIEIQRMVKMIVFLPKQAKKKRLLLLHLHHAQVPEEEYLKQKRHGSKRLIPKNSTKTHKSAKKDKTETHRQPINLQPQL